MSVADLVRDSEIQDLLEPLLPAGPTKLGMKIRISPQRNSGSLVGTAFDYAVRFELQRRYPHARSRSWVAESAIAEVDLGAARYALVDENGEEIWSVDAKLAARWGKVVGAARRAVTSYVANHAPDIAARKGIVQHALRLARIDPFVRVRYVEPDPEKVDAADVLDVLALLEIVPWNVLGSEASVLLNPSFGAQSKRVGGADADLICGDRLVDLKTATQPTPRGDLRQLLAYLILARAARAEDASFPAVASLGVYYARHGHLWTLPAAQFTDQSSFLGVERRFFERADELYATTREDTAGRDSDEPDPEEVKRRQNRVQGRERTPPTPKLDGKASRPPRATPVPERLRPGNSKVPTNQSLRPRRPTR